MNLAIPKPQHKQLKALDERLLRKKLLAEADHVFSLYIRKRDGKCMMKGRGCNCGGVLQCNHKISRANFRLRWDDRNAVAGCQGHNTWAHFNPVEWSELWKELWPEDIEYLEITRHSKGKTDIPTLRQIIALNYSKIK